MKKLIIICALPLSVLANNKSICGFDDRIPSKNPKIGRTLESFDSSNGCTVTMISDSCAISVGHCKQDFNIVQFNVPESKENGIAHPFPMDVYDIDQSSIEYRNNGPGDDWAVMKIKKNHFTNTLAGKAQGHYKIATEMPEVGSYISITGYGYDNEVERNFAQQSNIAEITAIGSKDRYNNHPATISHRVDTMVGNSGSSLINIKTNEIIGVHSHGGCSPGHYYPGANKGTSITLNKAFNKAVMKCLDSEKEQ